MLKEDKIGDPSYWLSSGHIAALFHDELYELRDGNAGIRQLMHFGVLFGSRRVVIYVKPDADQQITPNTARSQLLAGGETLPLGGVGGGVPRQPAQADSADDGRAAQPRQRR